jgi:type I restriction enzyme S subunit
MEMKMKFDSQSSLPDLWVWTTLQDVGDIYSGGTPSTKNSSNFEGDVPWITPADLSGYKNTYISKGRRNISLKAVNSSSAVLIPAGSVLFSSRAPIGYVAIVKNEVTTNQGFKSIKPLGGIISEYIFYYLKTIKDLAEAEASGTTFLEISKSKFESLPLPLAPIEEQRRIVAKIEELFTQLDAAETALQRVRINLERYRRSVLQAAVTGELTIEWREIHETDVEPVSETLKYVLCKRRVKFENHLNAKGNKSGLTFDDAFDDAMDILQTYQLYDLPEKWIWTTVRIVAADEPNSITDGPFGSNLKTEHYTESGPRVIRLQNIGDGFFINNFAHISEEHFTSLKKHQVLSGDLVIAGLGESLPRACIIPNFVGDAIVKADCIRFKPDPLLSNNIYLNAVLNSQLIKDVVKTIVHGIGRPRLNQQEIKAIPIPLPPVDEQYAIAEELQKTYSLSDDIEKKIDQSLTRIELTRKTILQQAYSGLLVDQNSDDESAAVLLQRIQAEREGRDKQQVPKPKKEKKKMADENKRKPLIETLHAAGTRLTPEELFRQAGFDEESVDEFYEELRRELQVEINGKVVKPGRIKEERPNQAYIFLSEVKL